MFTLLLHNTLLVCIQIDRFIQCMGCGPLNIWKYSYQPHAGNVAVHVVANSAFCVQDFCSKLRWHHWCFPVMPTFPEFCRWCASSLWIHRWRIRPASSCASPEALVLCRCFAKGPFSWLWTQLHRWWIEPRVYWAVAQPQWSWVLHGCQSRCHCWYHLRVNRNHYQAQVP